MQIKRAQFEFPLLQERVGVRRCNFVKTLTAIMKSGMILYRLCN